MAETLTTVSPAGARWELPDLVLRSPHADWNLARWETLPADGNRYEVIDGVLYVTTAPSSFHQFVTKQIARTHVPPGGVLDSPMLPIHTTIAGFFDGAPDPAV
jgi:hypothetical protein